MEYPNVTQSIELHYHVPLYLFYLDYIMLKSIIYYNFYYVFNVKQIFLQIYL